MKPLFAPAFAFSAAFFATACGAGSSDSPAGAFASGTGGSGSGAGGNATAGGAAGAGSSASWSGGAPGSTGGTSSAGGTGGGTGGSGGGTPPTPPAYSHTMDSIDIAPGDELTGVCQSWTLNNAEPLYVNRIEEHNDGNFHHSNWIWVTDDNYAGPDGTWKCTDRGFDQVLAGAIGGVFFAQSTQSPNDAQGFPPHVAYVIPAHARIVGDVHLLNATEDSVTTSLHFDVFTIPAADMSVQLQPMAFTNLNLDIAPQTTTKAHMQCATPQPDFDVYYVLPHYHALGQGMDITVAGGAMAGTSIFSSAGGYGEAMGKSYDPPISVHGASGLGITCTFENPGTASVHYGVGNQEMCVALVYSTGKKAGGETISNLSVTDTGGVHQTDGLCVAVGSP